VAAEKVIEYRKIIETMEYHLLRMDITEKETIFGCEQALSYQLPVVCVKRCYLHQSVNFLRGSSTIAATVIGYPFGDIPTSIKAAETKLALTEGVLELNVVSNTGYLLDGKDGLFQKDLESICCLARMNGAKINVILNSQLLSGELIEKAANCAVKIGAAWISPSNGLEEFDEAAHLPFLKKAAQGKTTLKTMTGIDGYDAWLEKYKLGFKRISTRDLNAFIKTLKENL